MTMNMSPLLNQRALLALFLAGFGLGSVLLYGAAAQAEESHHEMRHDHHVFHEHDVRLFGPHDLALWRTGAWRQEWHNGRFGWWWAVGGVWYFYERPVYPYPMVVADVMYMQPMVVPAPGYPPSVVVNPPSPQGTTVVAPQNRPAPTLFYCDSAKGYYPNVQQCPEPWRSVSAMPPGPAH